MLIDAKPKNKHRVVVKMKFTAVMKSFTYLFGIIQKKKKFKENFKRRCSDIFFFFPKYNEDHHIKHCIGDTQYSNT